MNYLKSKNLFLDILYLCGLSLLSAYLISFYFNAQNINVTYPDWLVQAFRVKELQLNGFTSWTHTWSNGINLWKSYQFIPHYLTLEVVNILHIGITRAMIILVIAQFILLRLITYISARVLKFSPTTALAGALATFSISYFWKAVGDYSLLFTFTFYPIMIVFWVNYVSGKLQNFYPFLSGLLFYIHPMLAITSFAMWAVAQLFTNKKILSLRVLLQFALFLAGSALFWSPLIFKNGYSSSSTYLATKEFLQVALDPLPFYGLSISLLCFFFAGLIQQIFPVNKKFSWVKIFYIFVFLYFLLVYIGVNVDLPGFIDQFQYSRAVGLIGIGIIFSILPMTEKILAKNNLLLRTGIATLLTLIVVEGIWITSLYSPSVLKSTADPVSTAKNQLSLRMTQERVWTPTIDLSSYYASSQKIGFPTSYMAHLESNQLPERLDQLITYRPFLNTIPFSEIDRINDYFMLTGVHYVFLDESSPFISVLSNPQSQYKYIGRVVISSGVYRVFQVPWSVRNAVVINPRIQSSMLAFPTSLQMNNPNDQIALDNYVKTFSDTIYDKSNTPLSVSYPTEETIEITIPKNRNSNLVFINESYDSSWDANFNNTKQQIKPIGPNFMAIKLNSGDEGVLFLKHRQTPIFYGSIWLILIAALFIVSINLQAYVLALFKMLMPARHTGLKKDFQYI